MYHLGLVVLYQKSCMSKMWRMHIELTAGLDSRGDNSKGQLGINQARFQAKPRILSSALFPRRADGNELDGTEGAFGITVWSVSCNCVVQVRRSHSYLQ